MAGQSQPHGARLTHLIVIDDHIEPCVPLGGIADLKEF
jgi:hypothetical protein